LVRAKENGWSFRSGDEKDLQVVLRQAVGHGRVGLGQMGATAQTLSARWSTQESARCIADAVLACMSDPQRRHSLRNRSSDVENAAGFENSPQR
jgi:hypothetical protein